MRDLLVKQILALSMSRDQLVSSKIEMLPDPMKWTDTYVETPMPTLCVIEPAKGNNTYTWTNQMLGRQDGAASISAGRRKMTNVEADLHEKQVQAKRRLSEYVKGGVHRRKMQELVKYDTIQRMEIDVCPSRSGTSYFSLSSQSNAAEARLGSTRSAVWDRHLLLAASDTPDVDDPADKAEILYMADYTNRNQMNADFQRVQDQAAHASPFGVSSPDIKGLLDVMIGAPDGVIALKKAGLDAVEDLVKVPISREELLLVCHTASLDGMSNFFGKCHSP